MSTDITGSCVCGAITVTLKGGYKDAKGIICHCNSCKKRGGCLASFSVAIPDADVIMTGSPVVYIQPTSTSGTRCERYFCGACGSHILGTSGIRAGFKFVKAALFDTPPPVLADVFMEDAYEWEGKVIGDLPDYDSKSPTEPAVRRQGRLFSAPDSSGGARLSEEASGDIAGSCVCGAVTVTLKSGYKDARGIICHCKSCKKRGGALASFSVAIPIADVVVNGKPVVYVQPTSTSGKRAERHFCGACGSHILNTSGRLPGFQLVKATLFDTPPPPARDVWMEDAYGWESRIVGDQRHPRSSSRGAVTRQDRPVFTTDPNASHSSSGNASEDTVQIRSEMLQIRADVLQMRSELAELRNLVNQLLLKQLGN